ncbi:MAG: HDIG domain-containing metalloprotein [Gemmatimonadota bacterium]
MGRVESALAAVRQAFRALSRSPGDSVPARVIHHGYRILLVVGVALLMPMLFPRVPVPDAVALQEGMVAAEDVIASFDFVVPKSPGRLKVERDEAAHSVPPVFVLDTAAVDTAVARTDDFFASLSEAAAAAGDQDSAGIQRYLRSLGMGTTAAQLSYLADEASSAELRQALTSAYESMLPSGVAPGLDMQGLTTSRIVVKTRDADLMVDRDSVVTVGQFFQAAAALAPSSAGADVFRLYQNLLVRFAQPSLVHDGSATEMARAEARAAVDTTAGFFLEGERLISAHERVGRPEAERLRAYNNELVQRGIASGAGGAAALAGSVLYGLLLVGGVALVLLFFRPEMYRDVRAVTIVMAHLVFVLVVASLIAAGSASQALIPIAFLALNIGILYDGLVALVVVMFAAALVAGQMAFFGLDVALLMIAGGGAATIGARGMRRRAQGWFVIAGISVAYLLAGAAIAGIRPLPLSTVWQTFLWGSINATLCTALAMGAALPLLERLTGRTTDQTLLELSDLNGPLLRDLSLKAPGTHAHSINVANLAEAACVAIGANPVLARVGSYYHDIGKMVQPHFFVENQPSGRNPHDRLPPARSAEIIRDHVSEGVRLASERRLPQTIQCFIREHHGTMAIEYFLDRAREEGAVDLDPGDFAYAGPRPQSRETAIVMLADGVESSSRVLGDPNPESIRELIDHIVDERIRARQLDDCPLTLADLEKVKVQFDRILTGLYHRRIDYPGGVTAGNGIGDSQPIGEAVTDGKVSA